VGKKSGVGKGDQANTLQIPGAQRLQLEGRAAKPGESPGAGGGDIRSRKSSVFRTGGFFRWEKKTI